MHPPTSRHHSHRRTPGLLDAASAAPCRVRTDASAILSCPPDEPPSPRPGLADKARPRCDIAHEVPVLKAIRMRGTIRMTDSSSSSVVRTARRLGSQDQVTIRTVQPFAATSTTSIFEITDTR